MSGSEQRLFFVHWNFDGEKFSSLASLLQESKNKEKNGLRVGNLDVLHVPRQCLNQHASSCRSFVSAQLRRGLWIPAMALAGPETERDGPGLVDWLARSETGMSWAFV